MVSEWVASECKWCVRVWIVTLYVCVHVCVWLCVSGCACVCGCVSMCVCVCVCVCVEEYESEIMYSTHYQTSSNNRASKEIETPRTDDKLSYHRNFLRSSVVRTTLVSSSTTVQVPCPVPWFEQVRGGSVGLKPPQTCSKHSSGQGTRPVVELHMSLMWFNPTDSAQTIALGKEQDLCWSLT